MPQARRPVPIRPPTGPDGCSPTPRPHAVGHREPHPRGWPTRSPGLLAATLVIATLACGEAPVALEVAGIGYTEEELLGLTPSRRAALAELTALAAAVDREAVDALGRPLLEKAATDRLWERLQAREILAREGVEEAVLEARYTSNPEHELTVRHLIVLSARYEGEATRAQARAKAERALERIRAGEPFPEVAAEVSEEPGAEGREGLLQPGRRGAWVDEFWNAASALEVGEISGVVETQYGFHVLRLEGRQVVPFAEVRDRVALEVARLIAPVSGDAATAPVPEGITRSEALAGDDESAVLATFQGGEVTLGHLLELAATLPPSRWDAVRNGTGTARQELLDEAARRAGVRVRAREAGLEPDPAAEAARLEEWRGRAQQWAGVLGFRPGMGAEGTKAAALAALSATGQMPQLTRDEVARIRGLLERWVGRSLSAPPAP